MICEEFQGVAGAAFCSRCNFRRRMHDPAVRAALNLAMEERKIREGRPATAADLEAAEVAPLARTLRVIPGGKR